MKKIIFLLFLQLKCTEPEFTGAHIADVSANISQYLGAFNSMSPASRAHWEASKLVRTQAYNRVNALWAECHNKIQALENLDGNTLPKVFQDLRVGLTGNIVPRLEQESDEDYTKKLDYGIKKIILSFKFNSDNYKSFKRALVELCIKNEFDVYLYLPFEREENTVDPNTRLVNVLMESCYMLDCDSPFTSNKDVDLFHMRLEGYYRIYPSTLVLKHHLIQNGTNPAEWMQSKIAILERHFYRLTNDLNSIRSENRFAPNVAIGCVLLSTMPYAMLSHDPVTEFRTIFPAALFCLTLGEQVAHMILSVKRYYEDKTKSNTLQTSIDLLD
jgi:hypothetical protein